MAESLARAMQVRVRRRSPVLNLKLSLVGASAMAGLLLSAGCATEAPEKAETPVAKTAAPATPAETPATLADTYTPKTDGAATAEFDKRVAAYVDVHKKADGQVPSLKRTDDPKEISSREFALGDAIRVLRADARPGDIMFREIAEEFRRLIKKDFRSRSPRERKIFLDEIPNFRPTINQRYPSEWPLATFPATLLDVMPKLPEILEYRLLSEALILRDVKANIVVDFILDVY
jgi:hypothetical protein